MTPPTAAAEPSFGSIAAHLISSGFQRIKRYGLHRDTKVVEAKGHSRFYFTG